MYKHVTPIAPLESAAVPEHGCGVPIVTETDFFTDYKQWTAVLAPCSRSVFLYLCIGEHDCTEHRHTFIEMIYVCRGSIEHTVDGIRIPMSAGDLCVLNPNARHQITQRDSVAQIAMINLIPSNLEGTLRAFYLDDNPTARFLRGKDANRQNYLLLQDRADFQYRRLIQDLLESTDSAEGTHSLIREAQMVLLLSLLSERGGWQQDCVNGTSQLLHYIRKNYKYSTLQDMAETFHYSPNYLSQLIKRQTGQRYSQIVMEARIMAAVDLLQTTNLPIEDIAAETGYNSASHFYKVFKGYYGVSPHQYRKAEMMAAGFM